jgi:hypothetical protein
VYNLILDYNLWQEVFELGKKKSLSPKREAFFRDSVPLKAESPELKNLLRARSHLLRLL